MKLQKNKSVVVIGAGVSGLSAAVYAQLSGFNVTVFEKHIIPGGLSTAWSRKGYLFEGGMHWLTGSSEKMPMYRIWKQTGALQENNPIYMRDPFYSYINGDKKVYFYRNLDKLVEHFIEVSPEDKKMIYRMKRDINKIKCVHKMVIDIPFLKAKHPCPPNLIEMIKMLPAALIYPYLTSISSEEYINKFKSEDIKHLLSTIIGYRYNAMSLLYTMASFASGDCGFPIGGSLRLTKNMADTFESLGGKIMYRKEVSKVLVENNKVKGVLVNGETIPCDSVIISEDTRKAIDTLFETPLNEKWAVQMRKKLVTEQTMFLCFGIKADLSNYPKGIVYPFEEPFEAGGLKFNELRINNYAEYENHAPKGSTSLTCLLLGNSYEYWKARKADGTYKEKKMEIAERILKFLEGKMPEIAGNVEVIDVSTPLTFERYTNCFEGSWMSVWQPKGRFVNNPYKSKKIEGVYFAGQRLEMPGGLPIATASGRIAAQYLCRDNHYVFVDER